MTSIKLQVVVVPENQRPYASPVAAQGLYHLPPGSAAKLNGHASWQSPSPNQHEHGFQSPYSVNNSSFSGPPAANSFDNSSIGSTPFVPLTESAIKFLHLAKPGQKLHQVCLDIIERAFKLYPNIGRLSVVNLQDVNRFDLDPDYFVEDVLWDYATLYVLTNSKLEPSSSSSVNSTPLKNGRGKKRAFHEASSSGGESSIQDSAKKPRAISKPLWPGQAVVTEATSPSSQEQLHVPRKRALKNGPGPKSTEKRSRAPEPKKPLRQEINSSPQEVEEPEVDSPQLALPPPNPADKRPALLGDPQKSPSPSPSRVTSVNLTEVGEVSLKPPSLEVPASQPEPSESSAASTASGAAKKPSPAKTPRQRKPKAKSQNAEDDATKENTEEAVEEGSQKATTKAAVKETSQKASKNAKEPPKQPPSQDSPSKASLSKEAPSKESPVKKSSAKESPVKTSPVKAVTSKENPTKEPSKESPAKASKKTAAKAAKPPASQSPAKTTENESSEVTEKTSEDPVPKPTSSKTSKSPAKSSKSPAKAVTTETSETNKNAKDTENANPTETPAADEGTKKIPEISKDIEGSQNAGVVVSSGEVESTPSAKPKRKRRTKKEMEEARRAAEEEAQKNKESGKEKEKDGGHKPDSAANSKPSSQSKSTAADVISSDGSGSDSGSDSDSSSDGEDDGESDGSESPKPPKPRLVTTPKKTEVVSKVTKPRAKASTSAVSAAAKTPAKAAAVVPVVAQTTSPVVQQDTRGLIGRGIGLLSKLAKQGVPDVKEQTGPKIPKKPVAPLAAPANDSDSDSGSDSESESDSGSDSESDDSDNNIPLSKRASSSKQRPDKKKRNTGFAALIRDARS